MGWIIGLGIVIVAALVGIGAVILSHFADYADAQDKTQW